MVILPVKERDARCSGFEWGEHQATEIGAQNHNVPMLVFHLGGNLEHPVNKSKSALLMKSKVVLSLLLLPLILPTNSWTGKDGRFANYLFNPCHEASPDIS